MNIHSNSEDARLGTILNKNINKSEGWGLGLTLIKGLSKAHGGIVKMESYPHKGTIFTVDLPLDRTRNDELNGGAELH